jgi:hypothetical protein
VLVKEGITNMNTLISLSFIASFKWFCFRTEYGNAACVLVESQTLGIMLCVLEHSFIFVGISNFNV